MVDGLLEGRLLDTGADDPQHHGDLQPSDCVEQRGEALLLDQPAHGQHPEPRVVVRMGARDETCDVDTVWEEVDPRTRHVDVLRHVGVARDDSSGGPGATSQVDRGDLPGVQRVHAEAEAHPEVTSRAGRDLGGMMGEVAVDSVDVGVLQVFDERRRLVCGVARRQHPEQREQLFDTWLGRLPVARLGRVDADQHALTCEGDQLPESERLGRSWEAAHHDR